MASEGYNPQNTTAPCDLPAPLSDESIVAAQRVVAANSVDFTDAAELLFMLGIHPAGIEVDKFVATTLITPQGQRVS